MIPHDDDDNVVDDDDDDAEEDDDDDDRGGNGDDDDDDAESHLWSEVAWLLRFRSNICWETFFSIKVKISKHFIKFHQLKLKHQSLLPIKVS